MSYDVPVQLPAFQYQIIGNYRLRLDASYHVVGQICVLHFHRYTVVPSCFCYWYNSVIGSIRKSEQDLVFFFSYACHETVSSSPECSRDSAIQFCQATGFDNVRHRLGLAARTEISVCKLLFPSAGIAVSLFRAKTVQQRPLLPREVETRLPDCLSHTR